MIAGQKNPLPLAPRRKGKERARSREGARNPLSASSGDIDRPGGVSEQRVACLLCRCKILHLVGLRRSLVRHAAKAPA